jgi:hypothetical protein
VEDYNLPCNNQRRVKKRSIMCPQKEMVHEEKMISYEVGDCKVGLQEP